MKSDGPTYPNDPTLQPLLKERQFLAAVLVGLPGLAYAYAEAFNALVNGAAYDATAATLALAANPITLYLAARQYPRGKATEAVGVALAPVMAPVSPDAADLTEADLAEAEQAAAVPASVREQLTEGEGQ